MAAALKSRAEVAEAVAASLNKHFDRRVIAPVSQVPNVYYLRRPSGIMQLDVDTAGGLPSATVHCISGPDSGGKTELLYRYMAQQQKYYGANCWLQLAAVEHPIDHFRLRRTGVIVAVPDDRIEQEQEQRKLLKRPLLTKDQVKELKRQVGTFELIHGNDMEDTLDAVLGTITRCRKMGVYPNIIGIDSLSAMAPRDTIGKDLDEHAARAAHANCATKFFQKYFPLVTQLDNNPCDTTMIVTQQVRANSAKASAPSFMQKFLPDYMVTGAHAVKHGKCFDIMVTTGAKEKEKGAGDDQKQLITKMMKWELVKAKAGSHEGVYGEVTFDFRAPAKIDYERTVLMAGLKYGVLRDTGGGKITWLRDKMAYGGIEKMSHTDFLVALKTDPKLDYAVRMDILSSIDIDCRYTS